MSKTSGRDWRPFVVLALGDMAAFLLFALLGVAGHEEGVTLPTVLKAAAPFAIAWLVLAPVFGAFRRGTVRSPPQALWRVPLIWLPIDGAALLLRGWWLDRPIVASFAVVTLVVAGLMLTSWRVGYAVFASRRARPMPGRGA